MEPKEKIELLQRALKQLIEEERGSLNPPSSRQDHESSAAVKDDGGRGDEHCPVLLSKLLSQLDSLKENQMLEQGKESAPNEVAIDGGCESIGNEEIMKEVREVKKQNTRTHWLLSVMIALTLTWQLSEVSLILKLKQGLSNPFRTIGGMLTGMFRGGPRPLNVQELEKDAAAKHNQIPQPYSFPGLTASDNPFKDEE